MKISLRGKTREDWLRLRKNGIGGSDAGAICGMNPYSSPVKVYLDKISDEMDTGDNEAMRVGRDLEDYVAKRFMEETGKKVRRSNFMYVNDRYPFMLADIDRLIVGENAALECKTANIYQSDKWKDGKIPESYYIQCQHYIATMDLNAVYIAVLIMGKGFLWQKIERDEELIGYLIAIEQDFWENQVMVKKMPAPDGSDSADKMIRQLFPQGAGKSIELNGFDEKLQRREEIRKLIDKMETEQKKIDQELKLYLGEHDANKGISSRYSVSWTPVTSMRVNTELLKQEKPDIYKKYCKESSYRRLSIRTA